MKKHLNIKIYGLVQGVFFRASAKEQADNLQIVGFAKNQDDGSVYIEVEGEEAELKQFLDWCHQGSVAARVEKVDIAKNNLKSFSEFSIF